MSLSSLSRVGKRATRNPIFVTNSRPLAHQTLTFNNKHLMCFRSTDYIYNIHFPGPVDIDIPEDFPVEKIVEFLKAFGRSELGFNILTPVQIKKPSKKLP